MKEKIIRVRKKGVLCHRNKFKFFRELHPEKWNDLRVEKEVDIDLEEWSKTFTEEFSVPLEQNAKVHFFSQNPGLGESQSKPKEKEFTNKPEKEEV